MARFLIPAADVSKGLPAIIAKAPELLTRYPRDPRSYLYQAIALIQAKDLAGAEKQMRAGLAEEDILRVLLTPMTKIHMQSYLALILTDEHRKDEAKEFAKAGCVNTSAPLHTSLVKAGLCGIPNS
jgi:rhomboid protease GluP